MNFGFTTDKAETAPNFSLNGWGLNEISKFLEDNTGLLVILYEAKNNCY